MRTGTTAVPLAIVFLLASCGGEAPSGESGRGDSGRRDPETPVTSSPGPQPSGPKRAGAERVEPQPGMAGVRPHQFEEVKVLDERTLRVFFYQGVAPCSVLDRADVEYGTKTVAVTLQVGHKPEAEDVACIQIAVLNYVDVDLQEPLDERRVVDGAR